MAPLPRFQSFEFNDSEWVPASLRDTLVETLSRSLERGGFLRPLVPFIRRFFEESNAGEVLDLCSGAGGPAMILCKEARSLDQDLPTILMTDLFPRVRSWARAKERYPGTIDFIAEPVDATAIPQALSTNRARVMINAFHHFPPQVASAILEDAVRSKAPIFIAEGFERNPLGALPMIPVGIPELVATPLLSPQDRLAKALWAWFTPIGLAAGTWDAIISTLRVYSEEDLQGFVEPLGDGYRWRYGTYDYPFGGRGCYFEGLPIA